jgi:hypothetical protein
VCLREAPTQSDVLKVEELAVNGFEYDDQEELFNALKEPSRPKTVRFQLAESEDVNACDSLWKAI